MKQCKSPSHKMYRDANESAEVAAILTEQKLRAAMAETGAARVIAIERWWDEAKEKALWIERLKKDADNALNAHFTRGCCYVPSTPRND